MKYSFVFIPNLEARVISRFPLRPIRAGTMMNNSGRVWKTGQYWTESRTRPAPTIPSPAHRYGGVTCTSTEVQLSENKALKLQIYIPRFINSLLPSSGSAKLAWLSLIPNSSNTHPSTHQTRLMFLLLLQLKIDWGGPGLVLIPIPPAPTHLPIHPPNH